MKNNLGIAAYLALILLYVLNDEDELSEEEAITALDLAERMTSTDLYKYEEDVTRAKLCFRVIEEYLKEQKA